MPGRPAAKPSESPAPRQREWRDLANQGREETLLRVVLDASPDDITISDLDGTIAIASPSAVRMFGYEREEEILGRPVFEGLGPEEWDRARATLARLSKGTAGSLGEYSAVRRDGSRFFIEVNTALVRGRDGKALGYVFIVRDVTRRTELERELKQHRDQLQTLVNERTAELKRSNDALQDMNAALKVLLAEREDDHRALERRVVRNVEQLVLRFVERLKRSTLDKDQRDCLEVIETHLNDICSPMMTTLGDFHLTPREMQVAALVRTGKTSKDIARVLHLSVASVGVHRRNIRTKLKLRGVAANLQVQLGRLGGDQPQPSRKAVQSR